MKRITFSMIICSFWVILTCIAAYFKDLSMEVMFAMIAIIHNTHLIGEKVVEYFEDQKK